MPVEPFWIKVNESSLRQGDYLPNCQVLVPPPTFAESQEIQDISVQVYNLIVLTQSCDLQNDKVALVAMCPIFLISKFEEDNPNFSTKGVWNQVLKGRVEGLHLLASPENPEDNQKAMVVDFREIYSLSFEYLNKRAGKIGDRWRLTSPFLEHFSQAFARFFMRVGLPSSIPEFK